MDASSAGGRVQVVEGGTRRQDSVANAFDRVDVRSDVVLVHDAARPFVTPDLISRSIDAAAAHGAAIVAVAVADTVKRVDGSGVVAETLPRETIFLAQTPQAFRRAVLGDASRSDAPASRRPTRPCSPSRPGTPCT